MSYTHSSLSAIRLTAAEILAIAVTDYVCKSYKISGGELPWGFYYDFVFYIPLGQEMLPLIEERMRYIILQNLEIKIHEMIPKNAADYLRHHHHFYAAHIVEASTEPLVQLFQMGEFVDRICGSTLSGAEELRAFRLLGISQRPPLVFRGNKSPVFRIYGTAFSSEKKVKHFIRNKNHYIEKDHLVCGEKWGLFNLQSYRSADHLEKLRLTWRGKGEQLLYDLKTLWRTLHLKEGCELIQTTGEDVKQAHDALCKDLNLLKKEPLCIAEMRPPSLTAVLDPINGLFSKEYVCKDYVHILCLRSHLTRKIISSLNFLEKIPKIFQLKSKRIIPSLHNIEKALKCGQKVQITWSIEDGYGRFWQGPCLKLRKCNEIYNIQWTAYFSIERIVALILENGGKDVMQRKRKID